MLFYTKYGCSICHESLIVNADDFETANRWAEQSAQDVYYSYDCNYLSDEDYEEYDEEDICDIEYQEMLSDIDWIVEPYDEKNEEHLDAMHEQGGVPFEI